MKSHDEQKSTRALALRAVLATVLVLGLLTVLQKTGVLVRQTDVPPQSVAETMGILDPGAPE